MLIDTFHNDFLMPFTEEKYILKQNRQSQNKHIKQTNTCSWGISCSSPLRPPSPEAKFVAFCSEKVFIVCILTKTRFAQKKNITFLSPTCCMSCWIWLGLIAPKGPCNMVNFIGPLDIMIKINMVFQIKVHTLHSLSFHNPVRDMFACIYEYFIEYFFTPSSTTNFHIVLCHFDSSGWRQRFELSNLTPTANCNILKIVFNMFDCCYFKQCSIC